MAISTICWSAMDRPRAGRSGSRSTPSRRIRAAVAARVALWSIRPRARRGLRPMKMFSAIDRSGKRVGSWWITAMPASRASRGAVEDDGLAVEQHLTGVRPVHPARVLISVDLPAPFSPARACTSPGSSSRETSRRARTAPKDLETPFSASTGAGPVSGGWVMGAPRRHRRQGAVWPPQCRERFQVDGRDGRHRSHVASMGADRKFSRAEGHADAREGRGRRTP